MTTSHPTDERAAKKTTTTTTTTATATTATSTVKDPSSGKRQAPLKPPSSSKQHSQQQQQQQKKAQKKQSKKHKKGEAPPPPRKKQYIPPVKPEGQLDPVDIYGLGITGTGYERVPAERVVTLRLLNKKDAATVEKALDELSSWITTGGSSSERAFTDLDETHLQHVAEALPVWVSRTQARVERFTVPLKSPVERMDAAWICLTLSLPFPLTTFRSLPIFPLPLSATNPCFK